MYYIDRLADTKYTDEFIFSVYFLEIKKVGCLILAVHYLLQNPSHTEL